jgi:hypothetical protein
MDALKKLAGLYIPASELLVMTEAALPSSISSPRVRERSMKRKSTTMIGHKAEKRRPRLVRAIATVRAMNQRISQWQAQTQMGKNGKKERDREDHKGERTNLRNKKFKTIGWHTISERLKRLFQR